MQKNNTSGTPQSLPDLFRRDPDRGQRWYRRLGPLTVDISRRHIHEARLGALLTRARQKGIPSAVAALFRGEAVNTTESRPALHWVLRAPDDELPDATLAREWRITRQRMREIAASVRAGEWHGVAGEPIRDVICLGIGGSELGPRLAVEALDTDEAPRLHFLANLDGARLESLLGRLDPAAALVLVTSKSFATAETLHNASAVVGWLRDGLQGAAGIGEQHLVAVTARPDRAHEFGVPETNVLALWDGVGGRFSLWSAAGLPVELAIGTEAFEALLGGAHTVDEHFRDAEPAENLPLLLGALDLERPVLAAVPYEERLALLPEYLMQLYMESLGKSVSAAGEPLPLHRAPLVFGATGTRAQHAFFQALHQGNLDALVEFVGVIEPGHGRAEDHRLLLANMLAQAAALAFGCDAAEVRAMLEAESVEQGMIETQLPHRACPGDRPSNLVLMDRLDARNLGALLAFYEHRVFVAGVLGGVNPFDQFGVELGKHLAKRVEPALRGEAVELPPGLETLMQTIRKGG